MGLTINQIISTYNLSIDEAIDKFIQNGYPWINKNLIDIDNNYFSFEVGYSLYLFFYNTKIYKLSIVDEESFFELNGLYSNGVFELSLFDLDGSELYSFSNDEEFAYEYNEGDFDWMEDDDDMYINDYLVDSDIF